MQTPRPPYRGGVLDEPRPGQEKSYMANNDSQIYGYELLQYGLPNYALMKMLYDCGGTITIPELRMNINLKDLKESFYNNLIPNLIIRCLRNFGIKAYTDEDLLKSIAKRASISTGKKYHFDYQDKIKNKINASIPNEWYIEISLDISLLSFYRSAIWLKDNKYQGINEKRGITENKVETFRALLESPQIDEEAKKWRAIAATLTKVVERRAALAVAQKWEGATHIQIYDSLFPQKSSKSPATKNSYISRLMTKAKEIAEKNPPLKICKNT